MSTASDLTGRHCEPCEAGTPPLSNKQADTLMQQISGWQRYDHLISRTYHFKDYYQTIAFVNAVAWLSHTEDHHPEITVTYNSCRVEYTTHSVHGLSENDFICAAKVNALFKI
jgi:4a-hydroxytetrahydrobiopterin dehydratase